MTGPCATAVAKAAADHDLQARDAEIEKGLRELEQLLKNAADFLKNIEKSADPFKKRLTTADLECADIVATAGDLIGALDPKPLDDHLKTVGEKIEEIRKRLNRQEIELDGFRNGLNPSCSPAEIAAAAKPYGSRISGGRQEALPEATKQVDALKGRRTELANEKARLAKILGVPENFTTFRTVGDYDTPTLVTVTVNRKETGKGSYPETPLADFKLRFGGRQRFALAVGAAYVFLDRVEYEAATGLELNKKGKPVVDDNGQTNVTRVISIKEDSSHLVVPGILLHTRLGSSRKLGIGHHFTFGVTARVEDDSLDAGLLAGYSASVAEERAFFTVGIYSDKRQELRGGFYVGAPLPDELANVPVETIRDTGVAIAFSWKFK